MSLVSKFRRDIHLHFEIKLLNKGSLDKVLYALKDKIHQNPVGRNGLETRETSIRRRFLETHVMGQFFETIGRQVYFFEKKTKIKCF